MEGNGPWLTVPERVDPQFTSYTVVGLKPFTTYRFRIQATNDIGPSGWSPESTEIRTLPAGEINFKRTLIYFLESFTLKRKNIFSSE